MSYISVSIPHSQGQTKTGGNVMEERTLLYQFLIVKVKQIFRKEVFRMKMFIVSIPHSQGQTK